MNREEFTEDRVGFVMFINFIATTVFFTKVDEAYCKIRGEL